MGGGGITYTKLGVEVFYVRMERGSWGHSGCSVQQPEASESSSSCPNLGTYSHISTFLSLSFSSFKTGHLAGLILEVLSHTGICASERAPGNPCRTREWSTSQRGPEGGWGLRGYCPGWCRVAASVPKCGFAGLCQARGFSALYNKPADRSQRREFFSPSTDAFTPTQAPARKREKKI